MKWLFCLFVAWPASATSIQFWHSMGGFKGQLVKELVSEFNRTNAGHNEIQAQYVGSYEEGLNKLRTSVLANREPHLVQITDVGTQVMIDSQRITPLQDFIDRDPTFPSAQILPAIRRYYEVSGRLYALPFASSNPVLYYDADAFARAGITQPPATFAELEKDAALLTDSAHRIYGLTWPLDSWFLEQFVAKQGALFVNHDNGQTGRATEANYLSEASIAFVSLWERLVKAGTFDNVGRGWDPAEQNFLSGRSRMLITSTSDVMEVTAEVHFKLGIAAIPGLTDHDPGGTVIGGNALWIMKNKPAAEQQVAFEFIKFMASASVQERWHTHTGYFPIRQDVIDHLRETGFYEKYPAAEIAIAQMKAAPDTFSARGARMGTFSEAREHIMTAVEEVLAGRADVRTALTRAKAKTDSSLRR